MPEQRQSATRESVWVQTERECVMTENKLAAYLDELKSLPGGGRCVVRLIEKTLITLKGSPVSAVLRLAIKTVTIPCVRVPR